MSKYLSFSTKFPAYHPRKGEETFFIEKIWSGLLEINSFWYTQFFPGYKGDESKDDEALCMAYYRKFKQYKPKYHTIREGSKWKVGDSFIPFHWSGQPYRSKWTRPFGDGDLAIPVERVWNFSFAGGAFYLNDRMFDGQVESHHELLELIAENDGLSKDDFLKWFKYPKTSKPMQIICWHPDIRYLDSDPKPIIEKPVNPNRKIIRIP